MKPPNDVDDETSVAGGAEDSGIMIVVAVPDGGTSTLFEDDDEAGWKVNEGVEVVSEGFEEEGAGTVMTTVSVTENIVVLERDGIGTTTVSVDDGTDIVIVTVVLADVPGETVPGGNGALMELDKETREADPIEDTDDGD